MFKKLLPILCLIGTLLLPNWIEAASTASCFDTDANTVLKFDNVADAATTVYDSKIGTARTWTAVGDAQIDTGQSKFGGSSIQFDGTGDYIKTANSADFSFGTSDFTIGFFIRFNSAIANANYMGTLYSEGWEIFYNNTTGKVEWYSHNVRSVNVAWAPSINTWYYFEVDRVSGTITIYIDGTSIGSAADSTDISSTQEFWIGQDATGGASFLNGWIDDLFIIKGLALHSGNFTAPARSYSNCQTQRNASVFSVS